MASSNRPVRPESSVSISSCAGMGTKTMSAAAAGPRGGTRGRPRGASVGSLSHQGTKSGKVFGHIALSGAINAVSGAAGAKGCALRPEPGTGGGVAAPCCCLTGAAAASSQFCGASVNAQSTPASRHHSSAAARPPAKPVLAKSVPDVSRCPITLMVLTLLAPAFKAIPSYSGYSVPCLWWNFCGRSERE